MRREHLEAFVGRDPRRELLRERHVRADVRAQALGSVPADHRPQLERPEAAPERHVPVAVVDHRAAVRGRVAQVLRQDRQRADERRAVGHPERVTVEIRQQPLVRVGGVAVDELQAVVEPAEFRSDSRYAGPGGVDVHPRAGLAGDGRELAHRVHRARPGGAHRRHDERGYDAVGEVGGDQLAQVIRSGGQRPGVDVDAPQRARAQARDAARLLDRRMRLSRRVHREAARGDAVAQRGAAARPVQCGEQRHERGVGRGVLDDAPAGAAAARRGAEARREVQQLGQPVQHVRLQLGGRGRRRPQHPLHAEARGQQIAEDGRAAGIGREVGEERRVLPVRDARQDRRVEVGEQVRERFTVLGRVRRQGGPDVTGGHLREHRQRFEAFLVVGDPVDDLVPVPPELRRRHVRRFGGRGGGATSLMRRTVTRRPTVPTMCRRCATARTTAHDRGPASSVPPVGFEPTSLSAMVFETTAVARFRHRGVTRWKC